VAKFLKRAFGLGVLSAAAYAVWRAVEARRDVGSLQWESQPFPFPPTPKEPDAVYEPERLSEAEPVVVPAPAPPPTPAPAWVAPVDGECPPGYPIKAKLASKIFHVPGGANYARTAPDRCYRDAPGAEADGLRAAKR